MDMVNVDFEWFDPNPEVDFHGLKTLLRQLLDIDNQLFDLSELADLILSQPLLGSTVKVDGAETDPYAFLTVLNLETHKVRCVGGGGGGVCVCAGTDARRTRRWSATCTPTSARRRPSCSLLRPRRSA
jgi:hypothetical protein